MAEINRIVINFDLNPRFLDRLRNTFPDIAFVPCFDREQLPEVLPGAQAFVGAAFTPELLAIASDLTWLHSQGTGVDRLIFPQLRDSEIVVTNNSGVQASNMAEHVLAMMLAFARGLPDLIRAQERASWRQPLRNQTRDQAGFYEHPTFELGGQTLAIAGLGSVGRALAVRARALGMRVVGFRKRPGELPEGIERLYGFDHWREMLEDADHVANCLPLTEETRSLFGAREFAAMPESACFYNVGRGKTVDQNALIDSLQRGVIAAAGLDVTDPEPLPSDSPLWRMPNVMITAHTSGLSPRRWDRGIEVLVENIRRFQADEPMLNVVDKHAGY